MLRLTAHSIKCTLIVTPDQLAGFAVPNGSGPVPFVIEIGHQRVSGQFNPKTLRKAIALAAQGIGKAVVIQGNLTETNTLEGAGISVPTPPPRQRWLRLRTELSRRHRVVVGVWRHLNPLPT